MKLIIAKNLITCAGKVEISETIQGILIENGVIKKVDGIKELSKELEDSSIEKIDAGESYVLPGLIDGHLHLSFSSSAQPLNEIYADTEEEILLRMVNAAEMELRSGVTTVRDCGAVGMSVLKLRDFIKKGIIQGSEIISSGMPITITGGHCNFCGLEADSKDDVVKAVRQMCKEGVDFIKIMVSGGNMTPGSNSLIDQYSEDILKAVVHEVHIRGKKVSGHVHSVDGIRRAVSAGVDTIEHCSFKYGDGEQFDEDIVAVMVEKGISINPAFGKAYILPPKLGAPLPDKVAMWKSFQNSRFYTTERMYNAGVTIFAGTDAGCKNTKFDEFYLTLDLLENKVHMKKEDILLSATSVCARELGIGHLIGSIEEGKQADIIFVNGNPLESFLNLKNISTVYKKGKKVKL